MANFTDLEFQPSIDPSSGWEAVFSFDNHWQIHIVAGPKVFTQDLTETQFLEDVNNYVTMEYKIFDGVTQLDDTNWIGGQSQEDISTEMARIETLEQVIPESTFDPLPSEEEPTP